MVRIYYAWTYYIITSVPAVIWSHVIPGWHTWYLIPGSAVRLTDWYDAAVRTSSYGTHLFSPIEMQFWFLQPVFVTTGRILGE